MTTTKPKKVTIIIPTYNQAKTIQKNIEKVEEAMEQTRWEHEIIVVVDGKPPTNTNDKTLEEAKKSENKIVRVYGYDTNKGKGYAIRYGIARSTGDFVAFIDAGTDINPNGISMILEHMEWYNADIVVGSKKHPASKVAYPFFRKIYSYGYHMLVKLMFGIKVKDTQTGLKVYKREILEKVLPRLVVKKFAFDIEILAVAKRLGYKRIYEAPVEINLDLCDTNFGANLILNKHIHAMLIDTFGVFYRMHFLKYYDDNSVRKWFYDKELDMRVNTGELGTR